MRVLPRAGRPEELIQQGRVTVNGHTVTELGTKADTEYDVVKVDGKRSISAPVTFISFSISRRM